MIAVLLVLCACLTMSHAFHFLPTHKHAPTTSTTMSLHGWRKALRTASILVPLSVSLQGFVAPSQAAMAPAPWDNKVQYEVLQTSPNGAQAKVGEIVAIRFQAKYKDFVIDDTFVTSDPYYMR